MGAISQKGADFLVRSRIADAAAAGRIGHAKLVKRIDIAAGRVGKPAAEEEIGTLLTNRHDELSPIRRRGQFSSQTL